MRVKYIILLSIMLSFSLSAQAEEAKFYIYGKCTLVNNIEYEGFINIEESRMWVSRFTTIKRINPYAQLFKGDGLILFGEDRNTTPSIHGFTCRYNDLKQIRPIAKDVLEVTIKSNLSIDVSYSFQKNITIHLADGTSKTLNWKNISRVEFMQAPSHTQAPRSYPKLFVGSVESTQGVYFGVVEGVNHSNKQTPILAATQDPYKGLTINDTKKIVSKKNRSVEVSLANKTQNTMVHRSLKMVRVTLPTMGTIDVPWSRVRSITKHDISELSGAMYGNSIPPKRLNGTVTLNYKRQSSTKDIADTTPEYPTYSGPMAYDLDEALNIEFIEGRNDGISYLLVLNAIQAIQPRNYNYSLIHLKNGSRLSMGTDQDVTFYNEGILMLNSKTYIPWRYIDIIHFND